MRNTALKNLTNSPLLHPPIKNLNSERLKRNLSSTSVEKHFKTPHANISIYENRLASQEKSIEDLEKFWKNIKNSSQKKISKSSFFRENKKKDNSTLNLSKCVPKSYIELDSSHQLNPKQHMKRIYQEYSNIHQKKKLSTSTLSTIHH